MYLFTRIKSPTNKVGIIDPDGIRNGSIKNERKINTINITGKNERAYSTMIGSCVCLRAAKNIVSINQINPVIALAKTKIVGKSKVIITLYLKNIINLY
jgi:hypothetical protein